MSNDTNSNLLERAAICVDYFEGKLPAILIEKDLDNNDMEELRVHVKQAEDVMYQLEYRPYEVYPEERYYDEIY